MYKIRCELKPSCYRGDNRWVFTFCEDIRESTCEVFMFYAESIEKSFSMVNPDELVSFNVESAGKHLIKAIQ